MEITLKDKNGVILHTAKKYCNEDINIKIQSQEIEINPSTEEQVKEGLFNKLTVPGDIDLIPENIKKGINIFGVDGGFDAVDTRDATATSNDIVEGTTAYVNNQKIDGNVPNNGELEYDPSDEDQEIPAGLTSGGIVKATDITNLNEYDVCLTLANSLETSEDYQDTTATPEDLKEGKTAYSNGERIVGTFKDTSTEAYKSSISGTDGYAITEIPDGITDIRQYAFYYINGVAITKIPASVKTVGNYAFYQIGQYNYKTLTIEGDLDSIGQNAFFASGYNIVLIPNATKVPSLRNKEAFEYVANTPATIYVPDTMLSAFRGTSTWDRLYSNIKPISEYQG